MTVGIYIRVSTEEQAKEGYSISAQRERLKAYCFAQDWQDFKIYVDEGVSAKNADRPQLKRLLQHIREGSVKTLLVYKLDRLTRSVGDLNAILNELKEYGAVFRSATEIFDTSSATGRLFIHIVGSMAQWESDNLGERVRVGQLEKARQGYWSAQAPYGFKKVDKKLVVVEEQKEVLLEMMDKIESGYSIRKLAKYLTDKGVKPIRGYQWHIATILDLMHNPVLYGSMRWGDEIIENTHEPIISKDEFDSLQRLLHTRQNFKKRDLKSVFIYQMKLVCPVCSSRLTCERVSWVRKLTNERMINNNYSCQVCTLNGRTPSFRISEKKLENALKDYMKDLIVEKDPESKDVKKKSSVLKEISTLENQRAKYQRAWASDLITDDEFTKLMRETKTLMEGLKKQQEVEEDRYDADPEDVKRYATSFVSNWDALTVEEKREFVQRFITEIHPERISGDSKKGNSDYVYEVTAVKFV